jgi:hypothetical protein
MTQDPKTHKVAKRLDVVSMYLSMGYAVNVFVEKFNHGEFYRKLRDDLGPIEAEDLDRWADICMGVAE